MWSFLEPHPTRHFRPSPHPLCRATEQNSFDFKGTSEELQNLGLVPSTDWSYGKSWSTTTFLLTFRLTILTKIIIWNYSEFRCTNWKLGLEKISTKEKLTQKCRKIATHDFEQKSYASSETLSAVYTTARITESDVFAYYSFIVVFKIYLKRKSNYFIWQVIIPVKILIYACDKKKHLQVSPYLEPTYM